MKIFKEINEIHYSKYQLNPKASLNAKSQHKPRSGALLRVNFTDFGVGYADCHPWEELGDLSLAAQLRLFELNKLTPLTKKSIYFAKVDAKNRSQNKSVFTNIKFPQNHLITPYESLDPQDIVSIKKRGFNFIKFKFGKNLEVEIEFIKKYYSLFIKNKIKIRLDFNSSLSKENVNKFFLAIEKQLDIIDFVEDPCNFIYGDWKKIQNNYAVNLALDKKTEKENELLQNNSAESDSSFQVIILKPAIEEMQYYMQHPPKQRIVFTSYMDHPLGQLCALYESELFYAQYPEKREIGGFLTHTLYEETPYSQYLEIKDTVLSVKLEPGFGFGNLIEKENWISI